MNTSSIPRPWSPEPEPVAVADVAVPPTPPLPEESP